MKFYIVKRADDMVNWDEFDSVVVYAHNKEEALKLAIEFQSYFAEKGTTVEFIRKDCKPRIVHESFNAG